VTPAAPPAQQPAAPEAAPVQETTPAAAAALPPAEAPPAQLPPGEPPARKTGLHRRAAEQAVSGAQIRAQRLARGWTQAELAQRVRLSRPFIALVEQGRRILAPDDLSRVREALGL
jgi:ribosome-binding protein aMBF1 (putative translation factor)